MIDSFSSQVSLESSLISAQRSSFSHRFLNAFALHSKSAENLHDSSSFGRFLRGIIVVLPIVASELIKSLKKNGKLLIPLADFNRIGAFTHS